MRHSSLEASLLARCAFPDDEHVYCAVSGGADSTALLALARIAGKRVTVVHVDHGLRPESAAEVEHVAAIARRFDAMFIVEQVELHDGPNLEARARAARRDVFPSGTLTGHTADDQAETMLLNLLRGAGTSGLSGMNPANKPLLSLRRSETRALCIALEIDAIDDPSNNDRRFRRNRVRHELLPLLDDIAERDVVGVLARQSTHIRDDSDLLDALAAELDVTDARVVAQAPLPLARRAIRTWLRSTLDDEQHPPDQAAIDRVVAVAKGEAIACDIGNGIAVRRSSQRLSIHVTPAI